MIKRCVLMAVILSIGFAPGMASAGLVDLKYVRVEPPTGVSIVEYGVARTVLTGNYVVNISGHGEFVGYCVDPSDAPSSSSYTTYDLRVITEGSGYEAAAWILSQKYTGNSRIAAQLAVWELTWDWGQGNAVSLASGNFSYTGTYAADTQTIITNALAGMGSGFDQAGYRLAVSPPTGEFFNVNYQDYVIPNVPIPPTVLLLGAGVLGMIGLRRKFAK